MARIDWVDQRLREWATWLVVGDGSGYSSKCTLHPEWSPPTPGTTPTMKVAPASHAARTHRAVVQMSERMQQTLKLRYCTQMSLQDQADMLGCQVATLESRLWQAHKLLAGVLRIMESG